MIQSAERFGFKIYYGDGARLDILHASGADTAEAIVVCVDDKDTTNKANHDQLRHWSSQNKIQNCSMSLN